MMRKEKKECGIEAMGEKAVSPKSSGSCLGWFVPSHSLTGGQDVALSLVDVSSTLTGEASGEGSLHEEWKGDGKGCLLEEGQQDPGTEPAMELEGGVSCHDFLAKEAGRVGVKEFLRSQLAGRSLGDVSQLLCTLFDEARVKCCFKHNKVKHSGGIFPLPETFAGLESCEIDLKVDVAWVVLAMSRSLNSFYGVDWREANAVTLAKKASVRSLATYAMEILKWSEKFAGVRWESLMSTRSVDYNGDEVRVARYFRWENLVGALPDEVGRINLEDVCELGTLEYVRRFEDFLLPKEAQVYTRPPRVMVDEDSWEQVCSGLVAKGICEFMPVSDVYHIGGKPLLNGLFGVSKDEHKDGWEVYRLIMNLVPVNKLCRNLGGDISTLPSWAGMTPYLINEGEVALISSEDIRCFFYLFTIPVQWKKYMGFNKRVPNGCLPDELKGRHCVLVSRVLPMGFLNSVSIAQHIHRRVVRNGLFSSSSQVGSHNEIRRDRALPNSSLVFRVYLDNFDLIQRVDSRTATLIQGEVSLDVLRLRQQYASLGLPRHPKKAVQQQHEGEIQGAMVNGVTGRVTPKPEKVLKYYELVLQLVAGGRASLKQMQIACGGLVYCSMFRRPLLGMLNNVWSFMTSLVLEPPVIRKPLPDNVRLELLRFLGALPLAQMNLRLSFSEEVTASDASEFGGGFCVSKKLTPMGVHAAHCSIRGDLPELEDHCQVLTVGLFDGIGALRVSADALVLPMAGHMSSEVSVEAARVLESHFPDSVSIGAVQDITEEMVVGWSCKFSNVGVVVVAGGPPCQGVSGLNSERKGALRDARSSLFPHVRRVYGLCRRHFKWAQVHYLMESVFSMDPDDRYVMSESIGSLPWVVDSLGIALCRRPRLYWISWELQDGEGVEIHPPEDDTFYGYGEVKLKTALEENEYLKSGCSLNSQEGLPTFTTSRPRTTPGNRPAGKWQCSEAELAHWESDQFRYPPYQYRWKHLVADAGESRLPTIGEKEVIMGFPLHYTATCLPKSKQQGSAYLDCRHTLIGNTWSVQVVTWLLANLFNPLGLTPIRSLSQVVGQLTPGRSSCLRGYLARPPIRVPRGPGLPDSHAILARKLSSFVSIKGEDILLQSPTEGTLKFHRLRTGVPAKLWRWRVIAGWRWKFRQAHINELELRAVLTTLAWRLERRRQFSTRFVHLVDSLVVLHCLSRGRSSARKLRHPLSQINSLLLAADVHPVWAYVSTKQNPADRPSRFNIRKNAKKKG